MNQYEGSPGYGGQTQGSNGHGFGQRVDQLNSSAHQFWDDARSAVADISGTRTSPKATAMLIAGMMAAAFGLLLSAFAFTVQPVESTR